MTRPTTSLALLLAGAAAATVLACGGVAVIDEQLDPSGGSGGVVLTNSSSSSSASSSSTGGSGGVGGMPGGAPPIPPLVETELGPVPMGVPIVFDVPPNTLGFTAVAQASDKFTLISFETLVAPDNTQLVTNGSIAGTAQDYEFYGSSVLSVPQTDELQEMPVMTGSWQMTLSSSDGAPSADVSIWRRQTLDGKFHGGRIDVNIYIAQGAPATQNQYQNLVHEALDGYAGLDVGDITFHTLGPEYAVIDDSNALQAFWETQGAPGKPAVNLIVTGLIDIANVGGFSPGAPALPLVHGTSQSGVVVMPFDPMVDALVVGHEVGHFSGLLHTSEFVPGLGDKLSDTPLCTNVEVNPSGCPDVDYLMFPAANPFGLQLLSPKQEIVLQGSAMYRGAVEAGGGFPGPLPLQGEQDGGNKASAMAVSRAVATSPASDPTLLAAGHDPTLLQFAASLWCGRSAAHLPPDYLGMMRTIAADPALMALAADVHAPAYVRMRALQALGRAPLTVELRRMLVAIARDRAGAQLARIGAMQALRQASPVEATRLSSSLLSDSDAIVRRVAQRSAARSN